MTILEREASLQTIDNQQKVTEVKMILYLNAQARRASGGRCSILSQ